MQVRDLIELLEDQDPEAEVLLMTQQSWPFENAVAGVASREDIVQDDPDEDAGTDDGAARNDVFIVEGSQLRYGSKAAWNVAQR
jgi:hypothetical protein